MAVSDQPDTVYSYNLHPSQAPPGIKVRWKIRIATGAEAEHLDTVQQQAIISLLTWANQHKNKHGNQHRNTTR
ncbi:MAG: hypothetical protein ACR2FU_01800 [Streptosporangiaceae bacterium]